MTEKFVEGPLLPKPQKVFAPIQFNWSTNVAIEGPGHKVNTYYEGEQPLPPAAKGDPSIVVRTGYAEVRAIFKLKKNILTEEEWKEVATEAMSRPECAAAGGTGNFGISEEAIKKVYKGISYLSEYPFPELKPAFCLEEMYEQVTFRCGGVGPCQINRPGVAGSTGAPCKPGDIISYSLCASMPCFCSSMSSQTPLISSLEKVLPTRHQLMMLQKFDEPAAEGLKDNQEDPMIDVEVLKKMKRSQAAKKAWETRRKNAGAKRLDGEAIVP
jgi:hypothetical protein